MARKKGERDTFIDDSSEVAAQLRSNRAIALLKLNQVHSLTSKPDLV